MKTLLSKLAWKTTALLLIVSMLFSIVKLPRAYAYFATDSPRESGGISFLIIMENEAHNAPAGLALGRPFLFEEEEPLETDGLAVMSMGFSLGGFNMNSGIDDSGESEQLQASSPGDYRMPFPGERVDAVISIDDPHFSANEIFIPSVKLHYEDNITFALAGEVIDGALLAAFDLLEIWNWFRESPDVPATITLAAAGEGYAEDGSVFAFSGEAEVNLKGRYDLWQLQIAGPDVLFIPQGGKIMYQYKAVDQNGSTLTGVKWALLEDVSGVHIDGRTGELAVEHGAAGNSVILEACLESQGRLHVDRMEIQLHSYPLLEIRGAGQITVPLPGESVVEPYELFLSPPFEPAGLSWEVSGNVQGVEVDDGGRVHLHGHAGGESFTLTALAEILGTPFAVHKEILLEIVTVTSVQIAGEQQIIVPESEPLTVYYTAEVYDPEGEKLPGEPVSWRLEPDQLTGITLSDDGALTVEPWAGATGVVLQAVSVRDPSISGALSVSVERIIDDPPPAVPGPAETLAIYGEDLVLIPAGENSKMLQYSVSPAANLSAQDVSWSLETPVSGVSLDGLGRLTVWGSAGEGSAVLLVQVEVPLDGADEENWELPSARKTVTLAHPAATSLKINGAPVAIAIPAGVHMETFQLSAAILDQKGNPFHGEISWRLDGALPGVELDGGGLLSVSSEAQAGSISVYASAQGLDAGAHILLSAPEPAPGGRGAAPGGEEKDPPAKEEDDPAILPGEDDDETADGKDGDKSDSHGEENGGTAGGGLFGAASITGLKDEDEIGEDTDPQRNDQGESLTNGKLEDDDPAANENDED